MKNSQEKKSLIQILGDKIFISIVSKHCKKFNFKITLFFKKSNQNCFHVIFQPVFNSNFELSLLRILNIITDFDVPESF